MSCARCVRTQISKILVQDFVRVFVPLLESEFQLRPTITTDDDHPVFDRTSYRLFGHMPVPLVVSALFVVGHYCRSKFGIGLEERDDDTHKILHEDF